MLVRLSGSTPSLDHSFDGISIGISLDHTQVISFWYVLLVEPSSCNLHEGTLVFLIQGGVNNRSPRLLPRFRTHLSIDSPFVFYFMCPDGRSSAAPVSSTAPKKKSFDRGGPV